MNLTQTPLGLVEGEEVFLFTLENDNNMTAKIMNYGAITSFGSGSNREKRDVVLGLDVLPII